MRHRWKGYPKLSVAFAAVWLAASSFARAEVASIYGGRDGLCGHPTANGERLNCGAMTAAHRTLPFGTGSTPAGSAVAVMLAPRF
jgi:rare lipoprotein A (peptidoglycan hydrolase)